jgi:PAS domain S-box-containing protein
VRKANEGDRSRATEALRPVKKAPHLTDEIERLAALRRYEILDTMPEQALDDLTALAGHICDTPIALITLIDEQRQWFKSKLGLSIAETARDISFCGHVIAQSDLFIVPDVMLDERFADSPLVTGDPHVRFYAGAPLVTPDGFRLGTLCVFDRVPRQLSPAQEEALRALSRQVMAQLDLRSQRRELLESEARLLIVFRNCPVGVAIHRWSDRTFVEVNAAFTALFGWESDELRGHTTQEMGIVQPAAAAGLRAHITAAETVSNAELVVQTRAGRILHVLLGSTLTALRGEPHTITTFVDITERKLAEIASNLLAAIVESSDDAIIGKDLDGVITSWNRGATKIFGFTPSEIIGTSIMRLIPHDRRDEEHHILDQIRKGESILHFETLRRAKDGHLLDVSVTTSPIRDAAGRVIGASKVARNITERKRSEAALKASEERMRFALENAEIGIWDIDYATGAVRWSPILEVQYGLRPGSFAGTMKAIVEHVHPDDRDAVVSALKAAIISGADFSTLNRSIWPNGEVHWLSGAGRIHLGTHGQPLRGVGISMDITERRSLEAQYQQAQKMEAVGRLAGGVAHDFNNLLTVILGYCELLLRDIDVDDARRTGVTEIQLAGMRASSLTRQLLAFSRKQIIEPAILDFNQIATDLEAMLGRLIGEDVEIVLSLLPDLWCVMADRGQIEQIVMNLVVNARDAMPDGGAITLETANVALDAEYSKEHPGVPAGDYVALVVTDTGIGMTAELQARIFEPFFTTKEVGRGTGLGMATVFGIVTQSRGSIEVHSEPGRGTSFRIYFPRSELTEIVQAVAIAEDLRNEVTQTVLVVEDEDGLRELARKLLEHLGYTVHVAANAREALKLVEEVPSIDVVLTDVIMPGTNGPELVRQLLERRPLLKVLYMSGYTDEAIDHHGVLKPGIAFLNKPFTSETLGEKLRNVLQL